MSDMAHSVAQRLLNFSKSSGEEQDYEGVRVQLRAMPGRIRIDLQVDVGFGDAITSAPDRITFPTLLDGPAPSLLAYPPYTAIAEKFQAMVVLDMADSRMKDFYDICVMFRSFPLDPQTLADAVKRTFARRNVDVPGETPLAIAAPIFRIKVIAEFRIKVMAENCTGNHPIYVRALDNVQSPAVRLGVGFIPRWHVHRRTVPGHGIPRPETQRFGFGNDKNSFTAPLNGKNPGGGSGL